MASGAAPCSEQRPSANEKEKGGGGPTRGRRTTHTGLMNAGGTLIGHCEMCVVCGDRACNHHYYGVAACHGCKCFFWRSIKNKMKYICRGDGQCEINPGHRNVCRYCRLQRCLKAGMQPDAVRMPKVMTEEEAELTKLAKKIESDWKNAQEKKTVPGQMGNDGSADGGGGHCPLCHQQKKADKEREEEGMGKGDGKEEHKKRKMPEEEAEEDGVRGEKQAKKINEGMGGNNDKMGENDGGQKQMNGPKLRGNSSKTIVTMMNQAPDEMEEAERSRMLVKKLIEIEMNINEVVDFSENEAPKRQIRLDSLFDYPEFLDRFRTQVNYCVRLRRVTEEELEFCKYRTLTKVVDYIRALCNLSPDNLPLESDCARNDPLTVQDKIVLLCHGFAPLVLFDIAAGTSFTTKDTQNLLCLPTGLTLCAGEPIVPNSFLSQQIVSRCICSLVRSLTELQLDQEEFVMMKLIVALALVDSANNDDNEEENATASGDKKLPHNAEAPLFLTPTLAKKNNGQLLSPQGRQFVEKLRDRVHAALYRHSPAKTTFSSSSTPLFPSNSGAAISSVSSSGAALRFAKLLHILPKLTLLSRDLIEHIRMVHTFPSTRTRPVDPLFFQLFGDIFNDNNQQNHGPPFSASNTIFGGSPFSSAAGSIPFDHHNQLNGQRGGRSFGVHQLTADSDGGGGIHQSGITPKMVSPPYKMEYGGSPPGHILAKPSYWHRTEESSSIGQTYIEDPPRMTSNVNTNIN